MKKIYIYALTTALIWGAAGCKKPSDFGDTNLNPNAVTTPSIAGLLTSAQNSTPGYASTNREAIAGAQYAQYFAETQYSGESLYTLPQNSFTGSYNGVLQDLQTIINLNQSKSQTAVATILQQYIFWVITDNWGDVPYSEALLGITSITPKYDTQEDIYKGILTKITAAVAMFDDSPISGDIMYGGDVASWKKAANSIRMLVSLQLSKRYPGAGDYAATQFKAALAAGGITENSDNLKVTYPGGSYKSQWYTLYDGRKDYAEANTMTDILKGLNDTRKNAYGGNSEIAGSTGSSDVGLTYGLERSKAIAFTDANPTWARVLRGDLRTAASPVYVITSAETWLARAEAAQIGWTTDVAATAYNQGIDQSFAQWGVAEPAGYKTSGGVVLTGVSGDYKTPLARITLQRWIASYPDGHQAWNIWRKSTTSANYDETTGIGGYPKLTPAPDATNESGKIVRRFVYEPKEYTTNQANVEAAAARIAGGDSQDSRVWWDVK